MYQVGRVACPAWETDEQCSKCANCPSGRFKVPGCSFSGVEACVTDVACSSGSMSVPDMSACQCPAEEPADGCRVEVACVGEKACREKTPDATGARGDPGLTSPGATAAHAPNLAPTPL